MFSDSADSDSEVVEGKSCNNELPSLNQSQKPNSVFVSNLTRILSRTTTVRQSWNLTLFILFSHCIITLLIFTVPIMLTDSDLAGLHSASRSTSTVSFCSETPLSVVLLERWENYTALMVKTKIKKNTKNSLFPFSSFLIHCDRLMNLLICLCR